MNFCTIEIIIGEGKTGTVTVTTNSSTQDITGWSARLVAKVNKSDTDAQAVYDQALVISDAPNGVFTYTITDTQSDTFSVATYFAEMVFTPATGQPFRIQGLLQAIEGIAD